MSDVSTEDRLDDVGTIEAIHAVDTDSTSLAVHKLTGAWSDVLDVIKPGAKVGGEVIKAVKLLLNEVNQLGKVLPLHLAALVMEVEPHILNELILHLINDVSEGSTDTELRAFLINQVDENLLTIGLLDLLNVFLSKLQ